MKKFVLLLSLSLSFTTLFASPAYVYRVESYFPDLGGYGYEGVNYTIMKEMNEACPDESEGCYAYIRPTSVYYTETLFEHQRRNSKNMRIYVHFPYSATSSTDAIGIRTRSFYQLFNGDNGVTIKDYNVDYSSWELATFPQSDGSKVVIYSVPDSSSYYKEITVTTCLDGHLPTDEGAVCTFVVVDVKASNDYGVELR
jgi:hypothetical protein